MSITQDRVVYSRSFDRPGIETPVIPTDIIILCLWAVVGLSISALAIQSGAAENIATVMAVAG